MPGLVLELQSDALNKAVTCADLLRKALAVSRKLGVAEIEEWLRRELNGYPLDDDEVPTYREVHGQIRVWNSYHGWQPLNFGDAEMAEQLSRRKVMQPVSELDALLENKDEGSLQIPFPQKTVNALMKAMDVPLQPTLHVASTSVVGILNAVRNHVLEWALELEKQGVIGEEMSFSQEEQKAADLVTYQITNNIGAMHNSQLQQDSPGATQNLNIGLDIQKVLALVAEIRAKEAELDLSADEATELSSELTTIEVQSESPKPKATIIKESLKSIRAILEGATGNVAASGLLALLASIL